MTKKTKTIFSFVTSSIFILPIITVAVSCTVVSGDGTNNEEPITPEKPNPPIKPDPEKPVDPEIPNPPIDPEKPLPPIQINDSQHSLSKSNILSATNPYQILKQTKTFKDSVNEIQRRMKQENWDFKGYNKTQFNEFLSLIDEVGIMNEFGDDQYQRMSLAAKDITLDNDMHQKLLKTFNSSEAANATVKSQNINEIILKNQFGFLPSNLSQLLYYLDLNSISSIFNIPNVHQIKMNFDDELGTANILIIDQYNKRFLFNYNANDPNCELKNNNYFRQFIFERSFVISFPRLAYTKPITPQVGRKYQDIEKYWLQGTGWLIDRIVDSNTPSGYYDFLVGTNLHVLDLSFAYNKERTKVNASNSLSDIDHAAFTKAEKTYDQKWDGGILSLPSENNNNSQSMDEIITNQENDMFVKYQSFKNNKRVSVKNNLIIKREKVNNNDNNLAGVPTNHFWNSTTQLNNENFVSDLVQYTPTFSTSGVYMDKSEITYPVFDLLPTYDPESYTKKDSNGNELAYNQWDGYRVGTISNAGADFAITKIRISANDVQTLFPTLYPLLNTPQEKDWYVGLGDNNEPTMVNANSTLFIGGYPAGNWKSIKSTSGKIYSQPRYLPKEEPGFTQTFWTQYNAADNEKYNKYRGSVNWYKQHFSSPSMTQEQNKKYMPHGMQIKKVLQQSLISFSNEGKHNKDDVLIGGASGSMMINSRGQIVGLLSQGISNDEPNSYANLGVLFKNYSRDNNFSIIKQVQQMLRNKNIKTLKLNK